MTGAALAKPPVLVVSAHSSLPQVPKYPTPNSQDLCLSPSSTQTSNWDHTFCSYVSISLSTLITALHLWRWISLSAVFPFRQVFPQQEDLQGSSGRTVNSYNFLHVIFLPLPLIFVAASQIPTRPLDEYRRLSYLSCTSSSVFHCQVEEFRKEAVKMPQYRVGRFRPKFLHMLKATRSRAPTASPTSPSIQPISIHRQPHVFTRMTDRNAAF